MAVLQAYQADLLKDLDAREGKESDEVAELRRATDLSLRATKETARAIGHSMAVLVATERHLWLNLSNMDDKDSLKEAVIRCKDCLLKACYCGKCDISKHQHLVFQNRETLIDGFYKPLPPSTTEQDLSDTNVIYGQVALICINGHNDMFLPVINFRTYLASWTPEVGDLLCSGYWPGTVEFQTIYQLDLFTSFEDLKITAPGLLRQAFVKMVHGKGICGTSTWAEARETSKKGLEILALSSKCGLSIPRNENLDSDEAISLSHACKGALYKIGVAKTKWAGTTISEEVEQVNSFLSCVALTTKYMSKAARVDMITLHARGWNVRKKTKNKSICLHGT
ncbi:hypothetical protein QQF64_012192 [Cirrhinus molitorella]|uniref:Uncharacterized protein n=1 Tax=Cirrhinus molitorella TaxID=172907 RepID=A0ABR3LYE1_9TELE